MLCVERTLFSPVSRDDTAIVDALSTAISSQVKGRLFAECSTIQPDTIKMLAKSTEVQGAEFVVSSGRDSHLIQLILWDSKHILWQSSMRWLWPKMDSKCQHHAENICLCSAVV